MSELKLTDREWRVFKIEELFDEFIRGNNKSIDVLGIGDIPYIGAKYNDNGIAGFADHKNPQAKRFRGNAIVFIMTGEGSVGKAVYKNEAFIPSNNVFIAYSPLLNKYNANFIVTAINNQSGRYNYGYIRNEKRLRNEKILLPITEYTDNNLAQPASQPASQIGLLWKPLSSKKSGQKSGRLQIC